jgi:pimeloyl-ACP methyl ester carboxylesterase
VVTEQDIELADGRALHVYEAGTGDLAVVWHHGTPNIGAPPEPLFEVADRLGIRWVSYDRPGYGGSTAVPGRVVASAAGDVAAVAEALGLARFAVMGHSGGGPHALACAALLPDQVLAAVSISGLAPFGAEGLDWFAGMGETSAASLRAAMAGRTEKERFEAAAEGEPDFIEADWDALRGPWSWFGQVVGPAIAAGPAALVDDDLAYVAPWGFDPSTISAPTLFLHGGRDRVVPSAHSEWLAGRCRGSEVRVSPEDGHVSVLTSAGPAALEWIRSL